MNKFLETETEHENHNAPVPVTWVGDLDHSFLRLGLSDVHDSRTLRLYRAAPETGTYSHHPCVLCHDGSVYTMWSNHMCDEDASGQRVLHSVSVDSGFAWSDWMELFPPQDRLCPWDEQDVNTARTMVPSGFAVARERVFAVCDVFVKRKQGLGRLARSIAPDGHLGPIFWLDSPPPTPKPGFAEYPSPDDEALKETAREIRQDLCNPFHFPTFDHLHGSAATQSSDGQPLIEPTHAWRASDQRLVRLWRDYSNETGVQYCQFGEADGTWSPPQAARFPDAHSRAAAGTLPSRQAYVINNPGRRRREWRSVNGCQQLFTGRDPLVLSRSRDGIYFDHHEILAAEAPPMRFEGKAKSCGYQYPQGSVDQNHLFVIYSVNKEDIEMCVVPVSGLVSRE